MWIKWEKVQKPIDYTPTNLKLGRDGWCLAGVTAQRVLVLGASINRPYVCVCLCVCAQMSTDKWLYVSSSVNKAYLVSSFSLISVTTAALKTTRVTKKRMWTTIGTITGNWQHMTLRSYSPLAREDREDRVGPEDRKQGQRENDYAQVLDWSDWSPNP